MKTKIELEKRHITCVIFYDLKNRILLQSRKTISKQGEEWGFFGGKVEAGETPEQALKREINEELSYDLKDFKFLKDYPPIVYTHKPMEVTYHVFIAKLPKLSEFKLLEGDGFELFSVEETKALKLLEMGHRLVADFDAFIKKHK